MPVNSSSEARDAAKMDPEELRVDLLDNVIQPYVKGMEEMWLIGADGAKKPRSFHGGLVPSKSSNKNEGFGFARATQWSPHVLKMLQVAGARYGCDLVNDERIKNRVINKTFEASLGDGAQVIAECIREKQRPKTITERIGAAVRSIFGGSSQPQGQ